MKKKVNVTIEGFEGDSRAFEIFPREDIENFILYGIDYVEVYRKTYKQAQGYIFGGVAKTYVDVRDGSIHTYCNYNHPYDDFYEVVICRISTCMDEPCGSEFLDDEEYEEYENGKYDNIEEYSEAKGIDMEKRLEELITSYGEDFEIDVNDIQEQLNIIYK